MIYFPKVINNLPVSVNKYFESFSPPFFYVMDFVYISTVIKDKAYEKKANDIVIPPNGEGLTAQQGFDHSPGRRG